MTLFPKMELNLDLADRQKFRTIEYWDKRFLEESKNPNSTHEWFSTYSDFRKIVTSIAPPSNTETILVLGCGNSTLSYDLLSDYKDSVITSHDYSSVVIESMKNLYKNESRLKWDVCDCRKIPKDQKYDFIIEKGVVDALVAGSRSPWPKDMDQECLDFVKETKESVIDVCDKFISISFTSPMLRYPLIKDDRWGIKKHTFVSTVSNFEYYLYECSLGEDDEENIVPISNDYSNVPVVVDLPENDIFNISV